MRLLCRLCCVSYHGNFVKYYTCMLTLFKHHTTVLLSFIMILDILFLVIYMLQKYELLQIYCGCSHYMLILNSYFTDPFVWWRKLTRTDPQRRLRFNATCREKHMGSHWKICGVYMYAEHCLSLLCLAHCEHKFRKNVVSFLLPNNYSVIWRRETSYK